MNTVGQGVSGLLVKLAQRSERIRVLNQLCDIIEQGGVADIALLRALMEEAERETEPGGSARSGGAAVLPQLLVGGPDETPGPPPPTPLEAIIMARLRARGLARPGLASPD
jgi:hypothetical protein